MCRQPSLSHSPIIAQAACVCSLCPLQRPLLSPWCCQSLAWTLPGLQPCVCRMHAGQQLHAPAHPSSTHQQRSGFLHCTEQTSIFMISAPYTSWPVMVPPTSSEQLLHLKSADLSNFYRGHCLRCVQGALTPQVVQRTSQKRSVRTPQQAAHSRSLTQAVASTCSGSWAARATPPAFGEHSLSGKRRFRKSSQRCVLVRALMHALPGKMPVDVQHDGVALQSDLKAAPYKEALGGLWRETWAWEKAVPQFPEGKCMRAHSHPSRKLEVSFLEGCRNLMRLQCDSSKSWPGLQRRT